LRKIFTETIITEKKLRFYILNRLKCLSDELNNIIIEKNSYRIDKFDEKIAENRQKWRQKKRDIRKFLLFHEKNTVFSFTQNLVVSSLAYITSSSLRKMESLSILGKTLLRYMVQSLDFKYFFQSIIHALSPIFRFPAALVLFLLPIYQKWIGPHFDSFRQMITVRIT
jgi:hypothetical protein